MFHFTSAYTPVKVTGYEKEKRRATYCEERWICSGSSGCTGYKSFGDFSRNQKAGKKAAVALGHFVLKKEMKKLWSKKLKTGKK